MKRRVVVAAISLIAISLTAVLVASALIWRMGGEPAVQTPVAPSEARAPASVAEPVPPAFAEVATPLTVAPGISIAVPAGWSYAVGPALPAYADHFPGSEPLLLLWRAGAGFADAPLRASLVHMPRNELDVPGYLEGVRAELSAAGLAVQPPALISKLRDDGLPAGQLVFRRAMPDGTELLGVQYVFATHDGSDLIAISLASAADLGPSAAADWSSLLRSLRLGDAS